MLVAPQGASAEHPLRKLGNQRKTSSPKPASPGIPNISAPMLQLLIKKAGRITSPESGTGHESVAQPDQEEAQLPWKMVSVLVPSFRAQKPNLKIYKSSSKRNIKFLPTSARSWGRVEPRNRHTKVGSQALAARTSPRSRPTRWAVGFFCQRRSPMNELGLGRRQRLSFATIFRRKLPEVAARAPQDRLPPHRARRWKRRGPSRPPWPPRKLPHPTAAVR